MKARLTEDTARRIVDQYFPDAAGLLIYGSQAARETLSPASDLDIMILSPAGYFKAIQRIIADDVALDVCVVPVNNFEHILLKDIGTTAVNSIVHALRHGKIITDPDGRLAQYQHFAALLMNESANVITADPDMLMGLAGSLDKYLSDLKARPLSLEAFILLSQLVNNIIDIELIYNTGKTTSGKVKCRLLQAINPELLADLEAAVAAIYQHDDRKPVAAIAENTISFYRELIVNRKTNYSMQYYWDDKICLDVHDRQFLSAFRQWLKEYPGRHIHYYYLHRPFLLNGEREDKLVIMGPQKELEMLVIPFLGKFNTPRPPVSPGKLVLFEIFFGGPAAFRYSESLFAAITALRSKEQAGESQSVDRSLFAITTIFFYSRADSMSVAHFHRFARYLFDHWFPFLYDHVGAPYTTLAGLQQNFTAELERHAAKQGAIIGYYQANYFPQWNEYPLESTWQQALLEQLTTVLAALREETLSIPPSEQKIAGSYSNGQDKGRWYIYRKQLETIFSILDISINDWCYLAFLILRTIPAGSEETICERAES